MGVITFFAVMICYPKELRNISALGITAYLLYSLDVFFSYGIVAGKNINFFMSMLPLLTIFMLRSNGIRHVLMGIKTVLAILISISFTLYILNLLGVSLPNSGVKSIAQYYYCDYYSIYIDVFRYEGKFCGFTYEPGYFSLLLVCLLLLNNYDFKKKSTYLYIASLLCTLSLGGYILGSIGFILQRSMTERRLTRGVTAFLLSLSIIVVFFVFALYYNGGDNIVAEKIIARMIYDEENIIVGNNRENIIAENIIDSYFYSEKVWMGVGYEEIGKIFSLEGFDACSWRVFVISRGAVYTLVIFFMSFIYMLKTKISLSLPLFVIYWLDFYQHGNIYSEVLILFVMHINANVEFQYPIKNET